MPKEPTTRLLLADKAGTRRKILTICHQTKPGNSMLGIYFPANIKEAKIFENGASQDVKCVVRDVHSVHIGYHQTGKISFSCYDSRGKKRPETLGQLTPNLPLGELSPGRCFLKVSPYQFERFPEELDAKRPTDVDLIEDSVLPDALRGRPIELFFWIGNGDAASISDKANAIKWFHIGRSKRYSEVFPLQHDTLSVQLFIAVVVPDELVFPTHTGVRIYTHNEPDVGFLRRKES